MVRVNNVNPVLLRVGSVASKSSVLNLLLILITLLAGKFQIKTPLHSCSRSYLMISMNVHFFVHFNCRSPDFMLSNKDLNIRSTNIRGSPSFQALLGTY